MQTLVKPPSPAKAMGGQYSVSVADYVRAVAPSVPPELVAPQSVAAVEAVGTLLPAAMTSHYGFECRLGVAEASADFSLMTSVENLGRDILNGRHPTVPPPTALTNNPRWARMRAFSAEWADPTSPLYDCADYICFEFDVADGNGATAPNNFFGQRYGKWLGDDARAAEPRAARARASLERGLALLAGGSLAPTIAGTLRDCCTALPASAAVFQAGVMGARTPAPVRLQLNSISRQEFLAFLDRLGWDGPFADLDSLMTDLSRFVDDIAPGVDLLGDGIGPKIGLECYIRDDGMASADGRWPIFLDDLVALGWCQAAKRDALLAYPGIVRQHADTPDWPLNLARSASLFGHHAIPVLVRYIHHIKIVFQNARTIEAKGYIGVAQKWAARVA